MGKIKEFFEHHEYKDIKPIRKPIKTSNYTTITSEWDNNFFTSMDEDQISDLVMVKNIYSKSPIHTFPRELDTFNVISSLIIVLLLLLVSLKVKICLL